MASYDIENNTKATREPTVLERLGNLEDYVKGPTGVGSLRERIAELERVLGIKSIELPVLRDREAR